ncbi:MAG: RNA polymerase sigma factor [Phycisphaerales bacterium]|nr:MAG: RNA polymerase sigma factor [Phycisphaerales bacterium]
MLDAKEEELIRRLKRGDRNALRDVYEQHSEYLLALAFSLLHEKSLAEDVLHDVFVKFAARAVKLRLRVSLKNYLRACVVSRIRDLHRRRKIRTRKPASSISDCIAPSTQAEFDELSQCIDSAMARLPYEQREVIVLHVQENMSLTDKGLMLDISPNTVKSRYQRGIKKLQVWLEHSPRSQESA